MALNYIKRVEVKNLWGKYNIVWDDLHPDVNILVGINGSAKSTLLKIIYAAISCDEKSIADIRFDSARIENVSNWHGIETISAKKKKITAGVGYAGEHLTNYQYISTFDMAVPDRKGWGLIDSPLVNELKKIILDVGKGTNSFTEYRLRATHSNEIKEKINNQIALFFSLIDDLFKNTGKTIAIDYNTNRIVFHSDFETIELEKLSAGEKQLLLILFRVFLMDQKPSVIVMDEPEISLHLGWQEDLIQTIQQLNPNCQLIIATHSPSIFGQGWSDKLVFMDKLFVD